MDGCGREERKEERKEKRKGSKSIKNVGAVVDGS